MYERILIATDGSDCSGAAIREGLKLAQSAASLVTLMFVVEPGREMDDANAALQVGHAIANVRGVLVTDRIAHGSPIVEIVREAESFDLIVMGSHGRGLLKRTIMGSVTEGVLGHLHRPLLIVPPPDEDTVRRPTSRPPRETQGP